MARSKQAIELFRSTTHFQSEQLDPLWTSCRRLAGLEGGYHCPVGLAPPRPLQPGGAPPLACTTRQKGVPLGACLDQGPGFYTAVSAGDSFAVDGETVRVMRVVEDQALYQRVSEAGDGELETMPCGATSIQGRRWRIC